MKLFLKRMLTAILLLSILMCASSCYDRRELDTLGIVMGVAIDKAEEQGDIKVTVQMANPAAGGEGSKKSGGKGDKSESGGSSKAYINLSSQGKNINTIIREMQHQMSRRIYVAHSQLIVISDEVAKEGVRDCLDFFARAPEARMTLFVLIAEGKADVTLDHDAEFEKLPSVELSKTLKDQKITSHVPMVSEFEFVSKLVSETTGAVAPLVKTVEKDGRVVVNVHGCAVFKESTMVGTFDEKQARGLLFVENEVKAGVINVPVNETMATIEIRSAKSKVKPTLYADGTAAFDIEINTTVGLGDQTGTFNLADPDNTGEMLKAAAAAIKDEVQSAVDKSKELNSDVFGFGEYLHRKYPDQWKELKMKWDDQYKNIRVNITVDAKADGSGRIVRPLIPLKD